MEQMKKDFSLRNQKKTNGFILIFTHRDELCESEQGKVGTN